MKIRKVFAFILSQVLCLFSISTVSLSTFADDVVDFEKVYVSAVVNGKNQNLSAIKTKDGNIFFSGKTLSDVTVYNNNTSDSLFEHDKVDPKNKYRSIKIDKSIKKAHLLSFGLGEPIIQKSVELPDIIEFENEVYYPIAEMLPILNANADVSDNKLYIEDVPYSMSNIMPEFNISNYMFNMYDDNDFFVFSHSQILAGYGYLFNGLVDFELKKFVPIVGTRFNKKEAYEEIFTSYLAEDEAYFEAVGDEEHYVFPMIKYLLDDDSERIDVVIEGTGAINDIIKDYSGYDISTEDLKLIKSSATLGKQIDHVIKLYSFAAIYTDHVTDHYEMLDAIYDFEATNKKNKNNIFVINEESFDSAQKIYKMYSNDQKQAIANYIGKQIESKFKDLIEDGVKESISNKLSLENAFAWSKLSASLMKAYYIATDFYVYNVSRKCENLPYYNKLMERGASKFWAYNNAKDNISKDNIEKARLSAIFTLLSSRSMYQAWYESDQALENSGATYQRRIDAINEALKKLYLAKNCCLTDSGEYIDERIKLLNSSLNTVSVMDLNTYELNSIFDSSIFAALTMCFQNDDINDEYMVNDLDNDGNLELAVYTNVSKNGGKSCILFENVINPGIYSFFGHVAAGYRVFVYDNESGKILLNNNWASASRPKIAYSEWNGQEWSLISLLSETISYDSFDISDCYWNNKTVSKEQFMELSDSIQNNWENSDYIFNNYTYHNLSDITEAFSNYLSDYYDIKSEISYMNNGIKTNIITINRIADRWLSNIVLLNDIAEENFNMLNYIQTTCFILDETKNGVRIRCQNYTDDVKFTVENDNIIAYKNGCPYIAKILSNDSSINKDIIILNDINSIASKESIGNLSNIPINLNAKTRARSGLVLREGPSTDTKQLDLIPYGTTIVVESLNDDYKHGIINDSMVKVVYNGKTGYVCSKYLLIDNTFDMETFTNEQKYAIGTLLYNQYNDLWFDFMHNGGIADCFVTDAIYYMEYIKLEPKGLSIDTLKSDYQLYYSKNVSDPGFDGLYIEKDGHLWHLTGYGGDPSWDYDEVVELLNSSNNRISYKVVHHIAPEFYEHYGYEYREEVFSLVYDEGRWKCDRISLHN